MRTIIAGGRDIYDFKLVQEAIQDSTFSISEVVCGMASGVDTEGFIWAQHNNVPFKEFPADWNGVDPETKKPYGKSAGPIRNRKMAKYAEALILIWNGNSPGSRSMFNIAISKRMPIYEVIIKDGKAIATNRYNYPSQVLS